MKNRSKAYIRHQRERIIRKKWSILKDVMLRESEYMPVRGTLSKGKIHCSCRICRYEQYHSIPRAKHKAKLKAMKQEIDDYVRFLFSYFTFISFRFAVAVTTLQLFYVTIYVKHITR